MRNIYQDSPETIDRLVLLRDKKDKIWQCVIKLAASDIFSDLTEEARIAEIWDYAEKLYKYGEIKDLL